MNLLSVLLALLPVLAVLVLLLWKRMAADQPGRIGGSGRADRLALFPDPAANYTHRKPGRDCRVPAYHADGRHLHFADHHHARERSDCSRGSAHQNHRTKRPDRPDHDHQHRIWHASGCPRSHSRFDLAAYHAGNGIFILHSHRLTSHWL